MVEYCINKDLSLSIKIGERVSEEEMMDMAFSVEGLSAGNPYTTVRLELEKDLPMKWVKYVEALCSDISNSYSIVSIPVI